MTVALAISGLQKTYANGFRALQGIDLEVQQGDFFALLGPNGAGKSTVIRILCSLTAKTAGSVRIFGADIDRNFPLAKSFIGVAPQEFNASLFETPMQVVLNQAGYYGIRRAVAAARAEEEFARLGLWGKRNEQCRTLSGGMKRRLMIARALVHRPRILILDEPTAGLDVELRRLMWRFMTDINRSGTTLILTTHYLEEAESLCRSIAIIHHGELVVNTATRELLGRVDLETLVLELAAPLAALPPSRFQLRRVDATTLEVDVRRETLLNAVFAELEQSGIRVTGMRNKTSRLESLFMGLVQGSEDATRAAAAALSAAAGD